MKNELTLFIMFRWWCCKVGEANFKWLFFRKKFFMALWQMPVSEQSQKPRHFRLALMNTTQTILVATSSLLRKTKMRERKIQRQWERGKERELNKKREIWERERERMKGERGKEREREKEREKEREIKEGKRERGKREKVIYWQT